MPRSDESKKKKITSWQQLEKPEQEFLKYLCQGLNDPAIAEEMDTRIHVQASLRDSIQKKLGNLNDVQLAVWFTKSQFNSTGV